MMSRFILAVLLLAAGAVVRAADIRQPTAQAPAVKPASPAASRPVAVRVLIAASREARLSAQMEGRVIAIPRTAGESFKRGEVLAEFDCANQRAELAMTTARLDRMTQTLESQQSLNKLDAVSDLELALARADAAEARARQQQAEVSVARCTVEAPYNGRVVRRIANQFETLAPGAPIVEIVETGALRLELLLPSRWLGWLKPGTKFQVMVDELGRSVPARITSIGSRVDPVSQTVTAQGVLTDPVPGILPGMSGSATFAGAMP